MKKPKIIINTNIGYEIIGYEILMNKFLNNKTRKNILSLISQNPKTISQIKKELNFSYSTIWEHIKKLKEFGFIILEQDKKKPGKPVLVSIKDNNIKDDDPKLDQYLLEQEQLSKENIKT